MFDNPPSPVAAVATPVRLCFYGVPLGVSRGKKRHVAERERRRRQEVRGAHPVVPDAGLHQAVADGQLCTSGLLPTWR